MSWGRRLDLTHCTECETDVDMDKEDDWYVCGDCEGVMCNSCWEESHCAFCTLLEAKGKDINYENSACCERCMDMCNDCAMERFHKECLARHLKMCNKKSRAKRALASANQTIKVKEEELGSAQKELAALQTHIAHLQAVLEQARKSKAAAEEAIKQEGNKEKAGQSEPKPAAAQAVKQPINKDIAGQIQSKPEAKRMRTAYL